MRKTIATVTLAGLAAISLAACTSSASDKDKAATDAQLDKYQRNQPIPNSDWSQGDVQTEGGPAHWDDAKGQIVLDGPPTVTAKTK